MEQRVSYNRSLRRATPTMPINPVPSRRKVEGSGMIVCVPMNGSKALMLEPDTIWMCPPTLIN